MRRQLEMHGKWLFAIAFLAAAATLSGGYILVKQRLTNPFADRLTLYADLRTTNGLNPGLSQPVNVAGVRVGTIAAAKLTDGVSRVRMEINRDDLPEVFRDARATLVPNTALEDMQIELVPGSPEAREMPEGGVIPVARTAPPIDSDELASALDADSRDFFAMLVGGLDGGTRGRGKDLNTLLKALEPTARQTRQVTTVLADRRTQIRRLVSNLGTLSRSVGRKDSELVRLIDDANATLGALGTEQAALGSSVAQLPPTLAAARRSLDNATGFANELGPALTALRPTARALPQMLRAAQPLLKDGEPLLRTKLRPFVREVQPLARDLAPTTRDLSRATPALSRAFETLNYVANELGHNAPGDDEGYLFWLAWLAHNGASILSTEDANGATARGLAIVSCRTLQEIPQIAPLAEALLGPVDC